MSLDLGEVERQKILRGAAALGVALSEAQVATLLTYLNLLFETNKSLNLTRIPREDYATLHVLDSLTCIAAFKDRESGQVVDVGTGAGFPGIPIAVAAPGLKVTLLDSTRKKLRFIEDSALACGIVNCSYLHSRAEAAGHSSEHRERYNIVVSRAVAPYHELIELLLPLAQVGGTILAMKGAGFEEEMKDTDTLLNDLGGGVSEVRHVRLPETAIERHIIVLKKLRPCSKRFPRSSVRGSRS